MDGDVQLMTLTSRDVTKKVKAMLRNAGGTRCSNAVLKDAMPFLVAVRNEVATLATTPEDLASVDNLTKKISSMQSGTSLKSSHMDSK
ncbi:MAG: hypothetical protein ABI885_11350 [Gammaproteobacteria bacterium]